MIFTSVTYNYNLGDLPARVNRDTGVLELNPYIWDALPPDYKDYVILHEKGHLVLMTKSEAEANKYAVSNFLPMAELTDAEAQRRITVLAEITNPENPYFGKNRPEPAENESNFVITAGVAALLSTIAGGGFSLLGKSKATRAQAEAEKRALKLMDAQNKAAAAKTQTIIIYAVLAALLIAVIWAFKKF